jgi:ATP-dependent exoDNAse (exonuclease V) alpha subunit
LNFEQRKAISHVLSSSDGIIAIEGGAGTGKTTLMSEVKKGIELNGKQIFAFAPSSEASRGVLRKEGFQEADTVASLLTNTKLQEQLRNQVIWIDEAGMVDNKSMNQVISVAKNQNSRLVLTGDTKQHASVARGDAFRIIQEKGGIPTVRVNEVVRQKNYKEYKEAMEIISKGDVNKAFDKLDNMGAIREISDKEKRFNEIAHEYLNGITERKGTGFKDVLVVAPTHKEGEIVTDNIRNTLRNAGKLGKGEQDFLRLKNLNFTEAQRKDAINYQSGQVVEFHQNIVGFKAGDKYLVSGKDEKGNILVKNGEKKQTLPFEQAKNFQVFNQEKIGFSEGDKIRITRNGKAIEGTKLNNGQIYKVNGFDNEGNIRLSNGSTLKKDFAHVNHGYAVTSDASQGKTVDKVIVAQSSLSLGASTKEQFYVSVSRGKESVSVYTDNKTELKEAVTNRTAERMTALELQRQNAERKINEQQFTVNRLLALSRTYASRVTNKVSETIQRYKTPNNPITPIQKPVNINEQSKATPPRKR